MQIGRGKVSNSEEEREEIEISILRLCGTNEPSLRGGGRAACAHATLDKRSLANVLLLDSAPRAKSFSSSPI